MSLRKTTFAIGEFYHVYNRGNHKREIFFNKHDYERFQRLLYLCNGTVPINIRDVRGSRVDFFRYERGAPLVAIGAYCLMPNHFHILATPLVEQGLSIFMKKLGTGYSMYFNKTYQSSGSLFEGRFKASHVGEDTYMKYLYSYIHLNPLKLINPQWKEKGVINTEKAKDYLKAFPFSSFQDYLDQPREERAILMPKHYPEYFKTPADHLHEVFSWFSQNPLGPS